MRLYCSKGRGWSEWRPDGKNYVINLSLMSQISHSRPLLGFDPAVHNEERFVKGTKLEESEKTRIALP
jgi:hypothetical protein